MVAADCAMQQDHAAVAGDAAARCAHGIRLRLQHAIGYVRVAHCDAALRANAASDRGGCAAVLCIRDGDVADAQRARAAMVEDAIEMVAVRSAVDAERAGTRPIDAEVLDTDDDLA